MFENIKTYPYRRNEHGGVKRRFSFRLKQGKRTYAASAFKPENVTWAGTAGFLMFGFFLGRAVLLGELMPLGVAFATAAVHVFGRAGLVSVPAVMVGLFTVSRGMPLAGSLITVAGILLLMGKLPAGAKEQKLFLPGLVFAMTIIVKVLVLVFTNPAAGSYSYYSVLFEAVFAGLFTAVSMYGMRAWQNRLATRQALSHEELFCVMLLLGGLIAGTGDLGSSLISVKDILSRLVILLTALIGGAGAGAAAGAVLGIVPGLAYATVPMLAPAYSFAGFIAGICRGFGKVGVAAGFVLANIILTVYVTGYGNLVSTLVETSLATVLFLLTPSFIIREITAAAGLADQEREEKPEHSLVSLGEVYGEKIKSWAQVFRELSLAFRQLSASADTGEDEKIQGAVNQLTQKVCDGCSFYRICWERDFYITYQAVIDLFAQLEMYGAITREHLPEIIKKRCSRAKELAVAVTCIYENYRQGRYWSERLLESREIVSEQLKGISEVIAKLPDQLAFQIDNVDAGYCLRKRLKDAGVKVESLTISSLGDERLEVTLSHSACGGDRQCENTIAPLLSDALERNFLLPTAGCVLPEEAEVCSLKIASDLKYRLNLGVSGMGQGGSLVSGDNHAFFYLKEGRFGLALSDGMGVGPKAAFESGTTLALLHHLLDLGFGEELAIKTVNSILVLRSPGESFATVDLTVIDLYSGLAGFIKIAAMPTFLLRRGTVSLIKAESLPVGIIEEFEIVSQSMVLESGDILVMLTDGLLEACGRRNEEERWLTEILEDAAGLPPQEIADLLLTLVQTSAGDAAKIPDDITVMVAKLER